MYAHAFLPTYIYTYMHTYIHMYLCMYVICVCIYANLCMICLCMYINVYIDIAYYAYTYIHACMKSHYSYEFTLH